MDESRREGGESETTLDDRRGTSRLSELPDRYTIRERDGNRELVCSDSPSMAVQVTRGLSIPGSAARKSAPGSIFLDGVAQEGPFLDVERHVYNLDHHQGCVRSFTLATCEQAMVIVLKGLDLRGRDWTIYANEPDLDTVLAIWVLLNHIHINDAKAAVRARIMPIVRLQGTIDAHGPQMQVLCGYPEDFLKTTGAELERLRAREVELKKEGKWQDVDSLDYVAEVLRSVDALVYSSWHFEDVLDVEELARAEIGDQNLAIVCRSEAGIYEVEQYLRRLHGSRMGIIALQKDSRTYTLRLADAFSPGTLQNVYEQLNLVDPAAGNRRSGNRWGGSAEIGGSPRATGTALTPTQIAKACTAALRKASNGERLGSIVIAASRSALVMLGSIGAVYLLSFINRSGVAPPVGTFHRTGLFTLLFCLLAGVLLKRASRPFPRLYGLCLPSTWDWLALAPTALLGGVLAGTWSYVEVVQGKGRFPDVSWNHFLVALALPVAAEALFRGYVHGLLAQVFRTQKPGGTWFLSCPALISALLYAFWSSIPILPFYSVRPVLKILGTVLFGLSAAMARERSESLLPPVLLHLSAIVLLFFERGAVLRRYTGV